MEYAIPRAHLAEAVRAVRAEIDDARLRRPFPLEVRFVAPDDALLSPAGGRDTGYVAVHMFRGMEWEPYFRAVEAIMDGFERPARTGASATSRPPRRCGRATPAGTASPPSATGSTRSAGSPTPTSSACWAGDP